MIEIFKKIPANVTGTNIVPSWNFISRGLRENIEVVETYYKNNVKPVKSDHFLVKLLQSIPVPKNLPLLKYYYGVDSIALNHSMTHKMTSSIYKGSVHRGIFYGGVIPEVLIATDAPFDFEEVNTNWKNISAIKPLIHPKSDLKLFIPDGKEYTKKYGLAILLINIPMLAVQYRAFVLNQAKTRPDSPRGTSYFVAAYVLPNMLKDNIEISYFNRLYNKVADIKTNNQSNYKHVFNTANYTSHVDHAIDQTVELLNKSDKSYIKVLTSIPSIYNSNIYETLLLPQMLQTRQVSWALLASRLKVINFLIKIAGNEAESKLNTPIYQTIRALNEFDCFNMFKTMLPLDIYFTLEEQVEEILESVSRTFLK